VAVDVLHELRLRPLGQEDLLAVLAWNQDPEITSLTGKQFQSAGDVFMWWQSLGAANGRLAFAITIHDRLVGDIVLDNISWRSGEAEVRICIGYREFWNRGLGTSAMARLLGYAFFQLGLHLIYLRVLEHNGRAIRSYEKLGFRKRARLPATGRLSGEPELWLMELTREAFEAGPYAGQGHTVSAVAALPAWTADV
jgi:RimJ/RimL family protein N-acetyltransferase